MVAVGRAILADPYWGNKAIAGEAVNVCYHCKPRCKYGSDGNQCPWGLLEVKNNRNRSLPGNKMVETIDMGRIGRIKSLAFDHPKIDKEHMHCKHVFII